MRDHPIIFNATDVRAILEGRKTAARRVVKPQPRPGTTHYAPNWRKNFVDGHFMPMAGAYVNGGGSGDSWCDGAIRCHYGEAGDRLWVKETWRAARRWDAAPPSALPHERGLTVAYAAGGSRAHDDAHHFVNDDAYSPWDADWMGRTRSPIHMPRWASRITLEVTGVRVERLQDISEEGAFAEGIQEIGGRYTFNGGLHESHTPLESFRALWESTGGDWEANPWVWVVEFKRVEVARG